MLRFALGPDSGEKQKFTWSFMAPRDIYQSALKQKLTITYKQMAQLSHSWLQSVSATCDHCKAADRKHLMEDGEHPGRINFWLCSNIVSDNALHDS